MDILFKEECYAIVGAAMKVHRALGHGFSENVYHEALIRELVKCGIPFETKKRFDVFYEGIKLDKYFVADLVCFDQIIVELKVTSVLVHANKLQVLNYLKASNMRLGILISFGTLSYLSTPHPLPPFEKFVSLMLLSFVKLVLIIRTICVQKLVLYGKTE